MPRVKIPRKSTAIDMTAMCDVAFLLLTFFILTAKPRTDDPVPIDLPASTQVLVLPDDVATLSVGQKKVFFGVEGDSIRRELFKQMASKYQLSVTQEEENRFASLSSFGVPMGQMKQFLALEPEQRKAFNQPGIPIDTTSQQNELYDWVRTARLVMKNIRGKEMRIAIKGDGKEEYPTIRLIVAVLQKQKVNKFALITALKSAPK